MLIQCGACGRGVSPQASTCPSCGHPISASLAAGAPATPTKPYAGMWLLYLLGFVVVLIVGAAWYKR